MTLDGENPFEGLSPDDWLRSFARQHMAAFIQYTFPRYKMGWVHEELCIALNEFLEAVVRRESPRLMVTMPPRHGKSEATTRRFPAFAFGRYPDLSIIGASYSATLATEMNRDVQRIMLSPEYARVFPKTRLGGPGAGSNSKAIRNTDKFEIVGRRGSYRGTGVGGPINGLGADILVIDDPIKGREEADSKVMRDKVWAWYRGDARARLEPGGGVLLINTRWHTDDLSGRLLEAQKSGDKHAEHWKLINFPAIAEEDEKHRKAGEALHPERYSLKDLKVLRATVGPRDWSALYQQRPTPDGGAIFKSDWLRFYTSASLPTRFDRLTMSWDMTFKESIGADLVVGQVWGQVGADHYLLDQVRGRYGFVETVRQFIALSKKWPRATAKYVEDTANGPAVIDTLKREIDGIIPVSPKGSKVARANAVTYAFAAGNVYLPDKSIYPWVDDLVSEVTTFPTVAHDDQVDAMTQYLSESKKTFRLVSNPNLEAFMSWHR